ncbi:fatty acid desaturase [Krasilnikovia sp. MM14-A1004]|uniref:fatty acid desaturase n=1 Tax=Krasilnikovia sp. MM14-A1004 TaxID=3373541 RepID=UPI00399D06D2
MRTIMSGAARTHGSTVASSVLVAVAAAVTCGQLFVLPLWLLPRTTAWGWLLVPFALFTTPLWSLLHEAIHGSLLRDRTWNDRYGRALAVCYGAPFPLLKAGHLLHHRFSRTPRERTEVYDPARTSWGAHAPAYYLRLVGGLYLAEAASVILAPVPRRGWALLARHLDGPGTVTAMLLDSVAARRLGTFRADAALIAGLYAAALVSYGTHGWMLVAALLARAFLVSVADNSYHYGTPLDEPLEAMNLRLPRPLETFVLAFNLHGVHHRHPGLAWPDLRRRFAAENDVFHLGWFGAVARQARGPIPATGVAGGPPPPGPTAASAGHRRGAAASRGEPGARTAPAGRP